MCSPLAIIGHPPATLFPNSFPTTLEDNDDATSPPAIVVIILCPSALSLPHIIFAAQRQQ